MGKVRSLDEQIYGIYWEAAGLLRATDSHVLAPSHMLYLLVGYHILTGPDPFSILARANERK